MPVPGNRTPWVRASIYRNNDFGFALGGPVFIPKVYHGKNKTFFFANYEGVRYSTAGVADLSDAPTAAMRAGDFSDATYDGVPPTLYDLDAPDSTLKRINSLVAGGINGISYQGCAAPPCIVRTVLLGDGRHIPASFMGGEPERPDRLRGGDTEPESSAHQRRRPVRHGGERLSGQIGHRLDPQHFRDPPG